MWVGGISVAESDFTTFMLWLESADVHLFDKVHPDSGIVQSGLLNFWDCSKLSQPVGCDLVPMLAPSIPPSDLPRDAGAYDKTCIRWVDLPPCIVGKASSLESHERVELISLVLSKDYDAPLLTLYNTALIDALCSSRGIFRVSITLDGNRTFHVDCLVPLSKVYTEYCTCESIIVQAVDSGSAQYLFADLHISLVRDCLLAKNTKTLGLACFRTPVCGKR